MNDGIVQNIGRHRLRVGSVFENLEALTVGVTPWCMYTDPPWGPGMMKFFANKRAKDTGLHTPVMDYLELLFVIARYAKTTVTGPVFIEYGLRWDAEVLGAADMAGLHHIDTLRARYAGGKTAQHLHVFWPDGLVPASFADVIRSDSYRAKVAAGKGGATNPKAALGPFAVQDHIVVDPCCGLGVVAKACIDLKLRFFGNELNAARAERTLEVLLKDHR